jgi:hypothetical protein
MTDTRSKFRPEPIPAAIPPTERGYFAVAPEPTRPGQVRLWLYGDGNRARPPRSILLTLRDVHGLRMFLADVEKGKRGKGRPEPIAAAIPASERGYFEAAPEPTRPGRFRPWLYGDGSRLRPRSILLTLRDVHGLRAFLADVEKGSQAAPQIASAAGSPSSPGRWRSGAAGGASPQRARSW